MPKLSTKKLSSTLQKRYVKRKLSRMPITLDSECWALLGKLANQAQFQDVLSLAEQHYSSLLDQLLLQKVELSPHEKGYLAGRMYEIELMVGALMAQGKKEVDKDRKADVVSKTLDELILDDPLKALSYLSRKVRPRKY